VEIERVRMATQTGRPVGDESFVGKVANLTGRDLSKGKAGRTRNQHFYTDEQDEQDKFRKFKKIRGRLL